MLVQQVEEKGRNQISLHDKTGVALDESGEWPIVVDPAGVAGQRGIAEQGAGIRAELARPERRSARRTRRAGLQGLSARHIDKALLLGDRDAFRVGDFVPQQQGDDRPHSAGPLADVDHVGQPRKRIADADRPVKLDASLHAESARQLDRR